MVYINMKYNGETETVDEFTTRKEAREMLAEYRMSDRASEYYMSQRACRDWMNR